MGSQENPVAPNEEYDADYYEWHLGPPYRHGDPQWEALFSSIAKAIVVELAPRTVLDVGCGIGLLVAALRRLGIEAWGLDVSEYAISQVPDEFKPFCRVSRVTEELDRRFDLISCIEVLEHLPRQEVGPAVANLARHSDSILFSSTPNDFLEPTHQNVQPTHYWVELFARESMFRDLDFDAGFVAPQAILFSRKLRSAAEVAVAYERWHWQTAAELNALRDARRSYYDGKVRLRHLEEANANVHEELNHLREQLMNARGDLLIANDARSTAAADAARLADELNAVRRLKVFRWSAGPRRIYAYLRELAPSRPPDRS